MNRVSAERTRSPDNSPVAGSVAIEFTDFHKQHTARVPGNLTRRRLTRQLSTTRPVYISIPSRVHVTRSQHGLFHGRRCNDSGFGRATQTLKQGRPARSSVSPPDGMPAAILRASVRHRDASIPRPRFRSTVIFSFPWPLPSPRSRLFLFSPGNDQ